MNKPTDSGLVSVVRGVSSSRRLALILLAGALAACGSAAGTSNDAAVADDTVVTATDAATDSAAADVVPDGPFMTADHNPLPQVPNNLGPVMHNVRIVTITYADDPNRATMEAFDQWIGGSDWLTTVGADYGVGAGTVLGNVEFTTNAPTAVTSTDIESMLAAGITDGSILSPPDGDLSNVLYMVYYPQSTVITLVDGQTRERSCQSFGGYHSEVNRGTVRLSYAAVPDCGGGFGGSDVASVQLAASHEYIEAATDPKPFTRPAWTLPPDGSTAWVFIGGEVGDLCELTHSVYQTPDGHVVQRIWSNTAAAAGLDPCIPSDSTRPYFNVSVSPSDVQYASPGDTVTFTFSGWSVQPMSNWQVDVQPASGNVDLTSEISDMVLNNGRTSTFTVTIPDGTPSNSYEAFLISSSEMSPRNHQVYPIAVIVQ